MIWSNVAVLTGPLCTPAACDSANPDGAGTIFAPSLPLPEVVLTGPLPCRVKVWLAGGSVTSTGWLIAVMLIVVLMVSPLRISISVTFRG
jgi:hypothetical protein